MHDSAAVTHCVTNVHHTKSLDAIDAPVTRVHGGRGRHYGSNQPVWCTNLPVLIASIVSWIMRHLVLHFQWIFERGLSLFFGSKGARCICILVGVNFFLLPRYDIMALPVVGFCDLLSTFLFFSVIN